MSTVSATSTDASSSGGKLCSVCQRSLDSTAFSGKQLKGPAKSRTCMECMVRVTKEQEEKRLLQAKVALDTEVVSQVVKDSMLSKLKKSHKPSDVAKARRAELKGEIIPGKLPLSATKAAPNSIFNAQTRTTIQRSKQHKLISSNLPPLLQDGDGEFLPRAEESLIEVFNRFGSLKRKDKEKSWNLDEIQQFAVATNGKKFTTEELLEIKDNLTHNDFGELTCRGFLDFYHLQTTSHPEETWKDLHKLGYDDKLVLTLPANKQNEIKDEANQGKQAEQKQKA